MEVWLALPLGIGNDLLFNAGCYRFVPQAFTKHRFHDLLVRDDLNTGILDGTQNHVLGLLVCHIPHLAASLYCIFSLTLSIAR